MAINPNGMGQVLLFPYFTVNKHQQTLLNVSNNSGHGKAIQIAFREAYNGRYVYLRDVFLGPSQTWAATVFALDDAGESSSGAGIASSSEACSQTLSTMASGTTPGGLHYDKFDNQHYFGSEADTGPTTDSRQREGYIEVIELGTVVGDTQKAITPSQNPDGPVCTTVVPTISAIADFANPSGDLAGNAAIVDVTQGTYYDVGPTAIEGFRKQFVMPPAVTDLSAAGDTTTANVNASVLINGNYTTLSFPKSRAIDAMSALFMSSRLYGEFNSSNSAGASTDWILTFPTKHYYVDHGGIDPAPFTESFGKTAGGSKINFAYAMFDRNGFDAYTNWCGFGECPPQPNFFKTETQTISFSKTNTDLNSTISNVFGSAVSSMLPVAGEVAGSAEISFQDFNLNESNEGAFLIGLPAIGMQAINYVNTSVTPGVLANYSGTARLRSQVDCVTGSSCE